jgi:hypothetical protein
MWDASVWLSPLKCNLRSPSRAAATQFSRRSSTKSVLSGWGQPAAARAASYADPAQRREGRLTAQAFRVVPHRDQQSDGRVRTDAHHLEQLRSAALHQPGQASFQVLDLFAELPDAPGHEP